MLKIDEHIAWPQQAQVVIGDYAENWNVNKLLTYRVEGDGKGRGGRKSDWAQQVLTERTTRCIIELIQQ